MTRTLSVASAFAVCSANIFGVTDVQFPSYYILEERDYSSSCEKHNSTQFAYFSCIFREAAEYLVRDEGLYRSLHNPNVGFGYTKKELVASAFRPESVPEFARFGYDPFGVFNGMYMTEQHPFVDKLIPYYWHNAEVPLPPELPVVLTEPVRDDYEFKPFP